MSIRNRRSMAGMLLVIFLMLVDVNGYSTVKSALLFVGGAVLYYLMVSDK